MADLDLEEELLQVAGRKRPRAGAQELLDEGEAGSNGSDISDHGAPKRARSGATSRRSAAGRAASPGESSDAGLEDDGYDSELIGDEEDRARLNKMSELEREMILAERSDAREQAKERRRLAQMVEQRTRDSRAIDKAKEMRSSTRMKQGDAPKKAAMAELAAARQERDVRKSKPEARGPQYTDESGDESLSDSDEEADERRDRRPRASQRASRSDDEDEPPSDDSDDNRLRRRDRPSAISDRFMPGEETAEAEEAAFDEARTVVVSRDNMEKWIDEPFFERTAAGLLARCNIPIDRARGRNKYLLMRIVEIVERPVGVYKDLGYGISSPYEFGMPPKKTSKWILAERGSSRKHVPIKFVSNTAPTEEEWDELSRVDREQGGRPLTRLDVKEGIDRLNEAQTYKYTAFDLQKKIQDRRDRGAVGNIVLEQARLNNLLSAATQSGNAEEEQRLTLKLAELEQRLAAKDQQKRKDMSDVNRRNVQANMKAVTGKEFDPFARRATKPGSYWKVKRGEETTLANGMPLSQDEVGLAMTAMDGASLPDTAANGLERSTSDVDANDAFKLNLDLTRLKLMPKRSAMAKKLGSISTKLYLSPAAQPTNLAGKSRLTLADYKRRHGGYR